MKIHDHEWNEHPDDLGVDPDGESSWEASLSKAGWIDGWKVGADDYEPTIIVRFRDDDWLVEAGCDATLALVRCDNFGQVLKIVAEMAPLVSLGWNIWRLPDAPIGERSIRVPNGDKPRWLTQHYLVTDPDDAIEQARRWGGTS